jgi:NAD(P)-dependent dehydrogenase (short-subunit alcohol dehydrogenase family)
MKQLEGKVAIITGGGRGIGFGIAEALGAEGCQLVLADIGEERMLAALDRLREKGCRGRGVRVDVTEDASVRALVADVERNEGGLDILVNSAGVAPHIIPAISLSTPEWWRVIDVNLFGVFVCCREIGGLMTRQQRGKIINIASLNAVSPAALCIAYNVAKAGVVSLTQTMAIELAPFGVRVNAISPGPIETEFHDTIMPERASTLGITREEMIEKVRLGIPLGRWGRPDDIADAVLFLASERSDWMTGQNLIISGGLSGVAASPPKEVILGSLEAFIRDQK